MKSARKEWSDSETQEQKAAWADKYAPLLMETWNNPIWVEGRAFTLSQLEQQMTDINAGEYPDEILTPGLENYIKALSLIRSNLKVIAGDVKGSPGVSVEELIDQVAIKISRTLSEYMDYDPETNSISFELVMVE